MTSQTGHFGTQYAFDFPESAPFPPIPQESSVAPVTDIRRPVGELPLQATEGSFEQLTVQDRIHPENPVPTPEATPVAPPSLPTDESPTVGNLLSALTRLASPPPGLGTMRTALGHACAYLGIAPEECPIEKLRRLGKDFAASLRERRYSRNSVKTWRTHICMFLRDIDSRGWAPVTDSGGDAGINISWRNIALKIASSPRHKGCIPVIRYAMQQSIKPDDFGDLGLSAWSTTMLAQHRTPQYVRSTVRDFRKAITELQLAQELPGMSPARPRLRYGVRFEHLPEPLQHEITEVLAWKQAPFAPGRSNKGKHQGRHRAITAEGFKAFLCRLYGFVVKRPHTTTGVQRELPAADVQPLAPTSLTQLVTPANIVEYSDWLINRLHRKSTSVKLYLAMLPGIFRHVRYSGQDLSWVQQIINDLPPDSVSAIHEAKQKKWVDYPVLREIPRNMRACRLAKADVAPETTAWLVEQELIIAFLAELHWRQRNVRECKLDSEENGGNLFKAPLPGCSTMAIPAWVSEALKVNPAETFWQVYFREQEIKVRAEPVRMVLPRVLIPLLEGYLCHRAVLLKGRPDPGTLFVCPPIKKNGHWQGGGKPFNKEQITYLVGRLTYKYAGRTVTPHLFRDIFAVYWLKEHPAEIAVVSRALWHSNIGTTMKKYAWAYDASHALARIEECMEDEYKD